MKVKIGISNRHIHITKETYEKLFSEPMKKVSDLSQIGEYVSDKTLTIEKNGIEIENVKVMGPFRSYNQIEISRKDALKLKVNPPVRESGDVSNSEYIVLKTEKNKVMSNGLIISNRHIHMNIDEAKKYGYNNNDKVYLKVDNEKGGYMMAFIKVKDNGFFEAHIDTDDAASFLLNNGDEVEIVNDI